MLPILLLQFAILISQRNLKRHKFNLPKIRTHPHSSTLHLWWTDVLIEFYCLKNFQLHKAIININLELNEKAELIFWNNWFPSRLKRKLQYWTPAGNGNPRKSTNTKLNSLDCLLHFLIKLSENVHLRARLMLLFL